MGTYETLLDQMFNEPRWRAPKLGPLSIALGALERALADLSQADPDAWSGAAAEGAASKFADLQERYGRMKDAVNDVVDTIEGANSARDRAYEEFNDLPSASVPSYVYQQVQAAQRAGEGSVRINGTNYWTQGAISSFRQKLEGEREAKAHQVYRNLQGDLEPQREKLRESKRELDEISGYSTGDDSANGPGGGGPFPKMPVPRPNPGGPGYPGLPDREYDYGRPDNPRDDYGLPPDGHGRVPERDSGKIPDWEREPDDWTRPPGSYDPSPSPPGSPTDPWQRSPEGTPVSGDPYRGPDVDSGARGTIGNPGLNGGLLGGAGLAGGAALRWMSQGGTLGPNAAGVGSPGGAGGFGGLGGAGTPGGAIGSGGAAGSTGAGSAIAGGRGLAGGLPSGGGAAGSSAVVGSGSGSGAGAAPRGGMMTGGQGGPGGSRDGKKSGLGGPVAPKLEDDDDFTAQSDSARAGSRDEVQE